MGESSAPPGTAGGGYGKNMVMNHVEENMEEEDLMDSDSSEDEQEDEDADIHVKNKIPKEEEGSCR